MSFCFFAHGFPLQGSSNLQTAPVRYPWASIGAVSLETSGGLVGDGSGVVEVEEDGLFWDETGVCCVPVVIEKGF